MVKAIWHSLVFHYKSTIIPTSMGGLPIFAEKLGHDRQ